jgi:hypothetical protein
VNLLKGDQALLNGKFNQAGDILNIELTHQPLAIGFNGFAREGKSFGNLGAGLTLNYQL